MAAPNYQLIPISSSHGRTNLEYIHHLESGLKLMVIPLLIFPTFEPDEREMHFFGCIFHLWFAFETTGYNDRHQPFIAPAMEWYGRLKLWPTLRPTMVDPRATTSKVVR